MQNNWYEETPFPQSDIASSEQEWKTLVEKTLRGTSFDDALVSQTLDDIDINPLYPQSKTSPSLSAGTDNWRIRQSFAHGTVADVNTQILEELEGGVSAIELCFESDHLSSDIDTSSGDQSSNSLRCQSLDDLQLLLTDVHPEMLHVSLKPGANNQLNAALFDSLWRKQGKDREKIRVAFNADPLGQTARSGSSDHNNGQYASSVIDLGNFALANYPNASSLCVDTSVYHNSGASEAQELGFALATGVDYLRVLTSAGMGTTDACKQMIFRYSLDSDFFLSVAKLRAARLLWSQVLVHCGIQSDQNSITMEVEAESGLRCLTQRDPWVNILRVTSQAFAALIGGASSFNSAPYDAALKDHSTLGRRIARNTQLILLEESQVQQVQDPLAGSGFIEAMTSELSSKAWSIFQGIEAQGGMWHALKNNHIQDLCTQSRTRREKSIALGRASIIGVSDYPDLEALKNPVDASPQGAGTSVQQAQQNISGNVAQNRLTSNTTIKEMGAAIDSGATTIEFYNPPGPEKLTVEPLTLYRDAAVFESMLARSDHHYQHHKIRPTVFLFTLGNASDYTARTTFCRNFFAIAGIDATETNLDEIANFPSAELKLVVLCSSNKCYEASAASTMDTLATAGATTVWLAGKAAALEPLLLEKGLDEQLHTRCDRVSVLNKTLSLLEVA